MKKRLIISFLLLALFLFVGNTSVLAKDQLELSSSDYSKIEEKMKIDGSSQKDIDNVIKKLKRNETLDSEKVEKEQMYFSNEELEEIANNSITDENPKKTHRFNDGSYISLELEVEEPANDSIKSINTNSTKASNGQFKTIKATGKNIFATASYKAQIYIDTHIGNNYINKVYSPNVHATLGTHSKRSLKITRKHEVRKKNITAKSRLYFKHTNFSNMSSKDYYLKVHTGNKINDRYGIWVSYTSGSSSYK